jgi:hypothetical protein
MECGFSTCTKSPSSCRSTGPLVIDAMEEFRSDGGRAIRNRWSSQQGPEFVHWLVKGRTSC